jgi:hypothetical protein
MLSSPLISANVRKEAELAILHNLPVITLFPDFARAGGLMAYGPNLLGVFRDNGGMIAKVLQGRKPADLPIQRPTKFELVINLKTAKTLGVTLPNTILALATRRSSKFAQFAAAPAQVSYWHTASFRCHAATGSLSERSRHQQLSQVAVLD